MCVANEDLRHGSPPGARDHFIAPGRLEIDSDFLDGSNTARLQQRLWQYGHTPVLYMITCVIVTPFVTSGAQRQSGLAPTGNSAGQHEHLGKAPATQQRGNAAGTGAGGAHQQHRFVLL